MDSYDAIVIGSGFGGSMAARPLVDAGMKVLMLERGDWVNRSAEENWGPNGSIELSPFYDKSSLLHVPVGGNKPTMGLYSCVGGPSVFYGGVSFRFREADFEKNEQIEGKDAQGWPISYNDLERYYTKAEGILNISGERGVDPTEPRDSAPLPQQISPLANISHRVKSSAQKLGLNPFQLPLAINYEDTSRQTCLSCKTCDTFACAVGAKNDLATTLIPGLMSKGMTLLPNMVVTQLNTRNGRIISVDCISKITRQQHTFKAGKFILAAGSLGSAHILLSSGLQQFNPGGHVVGRYLMRHLNAIIFGIFPGIADKQGRFHKQLAILDYYFGHPKVPEFNKLGSLQQMPTPPASVVENELKGVLGKVLSPAVKLLSGLLAIVEDQPQYNNALTIDTAFPDEFGLPRVMINHTYSDRDKAAMKVLTGEAKKIMKGAGALTHYTHGIRTFSHAVGTVRMGANEKTSALDESCRFRGIDNLFVTDGSVMPTSAALNPSLTIAANALRVGELISKLN
ncbi:GMC family oxidoreductase [Pedobacter sp. MC2016-15]|uniref:GMC family oxidoreductase n=1 Tax=Pedobacter sp. MC2016-15 TaxID=2994473 RepID=UPI0022477DF6|nr:GMC family oxidoreductase [Pedobacter sp. MC2016-15]MCX2481509.1 GMC family oxidoreductase [Pedobacter sp. MC2016-15]